MEEETAMNLGTGWDDCGLAPSAWADLLVRLRAEHARGRRSNPRDAAPLLDWGRVYLPHYFRRQPSAMHVWIGEQLDRAGGERGTRLNVIGPRGGAKSTLVSLAYVLRAALEGWEPYIWIVSDTRQQAQTHLASIRAELTDNQRLAADYPHAVGRGPIWRAYALALRHGVRIEAFGAGQRLRGRRHGAYRPTLIVCDDLENDSHMRSAAAREHSRGWFEGTLQKAGDKRTNVINLATALHRDALAMRLNHTAGWLSRVFSAIQRWPDNMSRWHEWELLYANASNERRAADARAFYEAHQAEMHAGAELLWPDEEDLYTLMRMRVESGRASFEREKQGEPISPELCEWPESYFDESIWFDEWPPQLPLRVIALDPSKGRDARHGDFSAFVLLGVDFGGTMWVEADLARRPLDEMIATGVELCRTFAADAFGVESNQFQELLSDQFLAELRRNGILHLTPFNIDNRLNKLVRIRRLSSLLARRVLRFKADSPSTRLLVDQLREFPLGDHDDGPDALEMAVRLAGELSSPLVSPDGLGDRLPISSF